VTDPELLINISMRFPNLDREALAQHLGPLIATAVAAGGMSTNISIQPYDPDSDDD
jgi:hypothetical protein